VIVITSYWAEKLWFISWNLVSIGKTVFVLLNISGFFIGESLLFFFLLCQVGFVGFCLLHFFFCSFPFCLCFSMGNGFDAFINKVSPLFLFLFPYFHHW
jgi:hypothetical protein